MYRGKIRRRKGTVPFFNRLIWRPARYSSRRRSTGFYKDIFRQRQYETFAELAKLRRYKFCESVPVGLARLDPPYSHCRMTNGGNCRRLKPRRLESAPAATPAAGREQGQVARRQLLREYWGALKIVPADLEVTDDEVAYMERKKRELQRPNSHEFGYGRLDACPRGDPAAACA